jgi:hypothetical protein
VLGAEEVVAEQSLQGRRVADRALLELGDQDGGAVPRVTGRGVADVRHGGSHLAGPAGADGAHPALLALQPSGGVGGGEAGEIVRVGGEPHEEDLGDGPAGGQPHQVEAERGGTDQ